MARQSAAPLTPGYVEEPLWLANLSPAPPADPAALPDRCDVLIVGGGYCGLAAAAELARRGRHVVLLEAGSMGTGASSRNGGMVIPELKFGHRTLAKRYGALGSELAGCVLDAYSLVERLVAEHAIECDYSCTGSLLLAHHPAQVSKLAAMEGEWHELGEVATFVPREELGREIGTDAYFGGLLLSKTAGLQPAKFHASLAGIAHDAGVEIHFDTPARALSRIGGRFRVTTGRGTVDADDVFVATNAYADGMLPALQRRVLPIGSFIVATEPLAPEVADDVMPGNRMCFDTKHLLFYWRLSPDKRMVFGGRTSLAYSSVARARDALYHAMVEVHPQLAGEPIAYAWGGSVAITRDRLPHCGRLDGVAFATGCNGTGVALATWLGTRVAAWIVGEEEAPPFARLRFPAIPMHSARTLWLPPAGVGLRVLDRWGR